MFVACGPSAVAAREHLDWGDLVTLNRALELFEHVDLALFGTGGKVRDTQQNWAGVDRFAILFDESDPDAYWAASLPPERLLPVTLPPPAAREPKGANRAKVIHEHIQAGNILGRAGLGLFVLKQLGYTDVWLFGHDGGHERSPELQMSASQRSYDKSRFCTQEILRYLRLRGTFFPGPAPR